MKEIIKQAIQQEINALNTLIDCDMDEFNKIAHVMCQCTGKLVFMGIGKSGHIGKKLAATYSSLGIPAIFVHASESVHGDLGMIQENDIVIMLSNSGATEEVLQNLLPLKIIGVVTVALCGVEDSPLSTECDYALLYKKPKEADEWNLAPTASTTMMLVLGDALACAISHYQNFQKADFQKNHPGGVLGKL